jgi:sec-independent protein translocase protein TatC
MSNANEPPDPDDMFSDTRMSFGDHIEDLRTHMLRALKCLAIGMIFGFWPLGNYVLQIIMDPVEDQLAEFEKRKLANELKDTAARIKGSGLAMPKIRTSIEVDKNEWLEAMGLIKPREERVLDNLTDELDRIRIDIEKMHMDPEEAKLLEAEIRRRSNLVKVNMRIADPFAFNEQVLKLQGQVRRPKLSTMHITEAFLVYFKVAMMTGLVISSPWVFYHLWMFIAAGLYPQEKKLVNVYLPFSLFLFIGGVVICQFLVMPKAVEAMLWFNEWLGLSADLRLNEWLGFALMMPIVFGASFQTPLVMMFLHRVGILTIQTFRDYRRMSWFIMAIFAAVITPSVDAMSMLFLWGPMIGLYELGILLCVYQGEQESLADWEKEEQANELVEV